MAEANSPPANTQAPVTTLTTAKPLTTRSQGSASDSGTPMQREISQLARMRALLPKDPRAAYRLAEAGHREFGSSFLYHEREALAIMALWSLGERERAETRGRIFSSRYPQSPFRARIEAMHTAAPREPSP
jgi:hypothetical protein